MAAWQFSFFVAPRPGSRRRLEDVSVDCYEEAMFWGLRQPSADCLTRLEALLPRTSHWDRECRAFGSEDRDHIEVQLEDGRCTSIRIRVDLRSLDVEFLRNVAKIGSDCAWVFVTEDRRVVAPEFAELLHAATASRAAAFLAKFP